MSKDTGTQKVVQQTELPAWYESAATDTIAFAKNAANSIAQPYMGNTVAPLDPLTKQAISATQGNIGSTNAGYGQAQAGAQASMGYNPSQIQGGSYLDQSIDPYLNPWIDNVEKAGLSTLDQQYRQGLNALGDTAIGAKAFGGSRQGVREGAAAADYARQSAEFSANLRNQGYNQARQLQGEDLTRRYNASAANQQAGLQGAQLRQQGSQLMGQLTADKQQAYLSSIQAALAAGQISQQQAQALLDQTKSQYDAMRQVPLEQLNMMLSALGGTQVPTSSTTKTPTTGNSVLAGVGAAGTLASGAAALLPLLGFSDRRAKTNIEKLGKDGLTGLPLYAYDYKADVQAAKKSGRPMGPKRVGPMAQDIERQDPGRIRHVGGKKVVANLGFGG
jgi:hypothetical protein